MNGFEKHGIGHLSASSINCWIEAPDVWVSKYLLGHRFPFGAAAKRGTVIEEGVARLLVGDTETNAIAAALEQYDRGFPVPSPVTQKQRDMIEPSIKIAFEALKGFGDPDFPENGGQHKIEILARGDGWAVPVIGYLDFVFPDHGLVIDLKTTAACPSSMSRSHKLQRAIYSLAKGNMAVKFLYVTPKKSALLEDGDPGSIMREAKAEITRMERFLSKVENGEEAISILPHNSGSFYWSGAEDVARAVYG